MLLAIGITIVLAKMTTKKDNEEIKEEVEKLVEKDAEKTIKEAKRWLENEKINGGINMGEVHNNNTLGELLSLKPTEKDYKNFIRKVSNRVQELYGDYQFFLYEPNKKDLVSGYLVQFQILGHEKIYNELFVYAMDKGLDMDKVDEYFLDEVKSGNVIPIGEGIIIDKTGTGISPIKSGDDVRIIISFVTEEYKQRQDEAEAKKSEK